MRGRPAPARRGVRGGCRGTRRDRDGAAGRRRGARGELDARRDARRGRGRRDRRLDPRRREQARLRRDRDGGRARVARTRRRVRPARGGDRRRARTRAAQAQPERVRTQRGGDRALPQVRLRRGGPPRQAVPAAERRALGRGRHGAPAVNDDWLELSYGSFGAVEDAFHDALEQSLAPRGPDVLYDLVGGMGLVPGMAAVDVGCGEGRHTGRLAERFGLVVTGVNPVPSQLELARAASPSCRFELGRAEALPLADESVDLVWCRDVLVHVADLDRAYAEFRRVLRPGGWALVYQMFATPRLEPREASWFLPMTGIVPASADPARTEAAIDRWGLVIDELVVLGSEAGGRALLWEGGSGGAPRAGCGPCWRMVRGPACV